MLIYNKFKAQTLNGNATGNYRCQLLASRALNMSCSFSQSASSIESRCVVKHWPTSLVCTWVTRSEWVDFEIINLNIYVWALVRLITSVTESVWFFFLLIHFLLDQVWPQTHYTDVIMGAIVSQITSLTIVYSTVCSDADQRKRHSSAWLAFVRGIHRRIPRTNGQ